MCIHYNLRLLHFLITKDLGVWWKNHFTHKHIILITPQAFFLWFENIVISNCNECKLLTFTQKSRRAFEHAHAQRLVFLWLSLFKIFFLKICVYGLKLTRYFSLITIVRTNIWSTAQGVWTKTQWAQNNEFVREWAWYWTFNELEYWSQ